MRSRKPAIVSLQKRLRVWSEVELSRPKAKAAHADSLIDWINELGQKRVAEVNDAIVSLWRTGSDRYRFF